MTNDLYWVSVLGYIVITLTILIRERKYISLIPQHYNLTLFISS